MAAYERPPFAIFEVTGNEFFSGWNLVEKKFEDVQAEAAKLSSGQFGVLD